jgi:hypothetical protein
MDDSLGQAETDAEAAAGAQRRPYQPPTVTYLGDLADLTQQTKATGSFDGTSFLGIELGS